jgi:hypothetical protein
MADITTIKTFDQLEGEETVTLMRTYVSRIIDGILFVNILSTDDSGNTQEIPVMEQPWKPNPDGTRSDWISDTDAAAWLDTNL